MVKGQGQPVFTGVASSVTNAVGALAGAVKHPIWRRPSAAPQASQQAPARPRTGPASALKHHRSISNPTGIQMVWRQ